MSKTLFSDLGAQNARQAAAAQEHLAKTSNFDAFGAGEALARADQKIIEDQKRLQERQSPPGTFKIPPLLEQRRISHVIPDGAFRRAPIWDWCFVYQIARKDISDGDTYGNTRIIMSANTRDYKRNESPRAILVAAGPMALDTLSSHGIHVGDVVFMIRNAPWAIEVDELDGRPIYMHCLRDADLVAGEDLQKRIDAGVLKIERGADGKHKYVTENGETLDPCSPWVPDDL